MDVDWPRENGGELGKDPPEAHFFAVLRCEFGRRRAYDLSEVSSADEVDAQAGKS
jgi:hypothetical protein